MTTAPHLDSTNAPLMWDRLSSRSCRRHPSGERESCRVGTAHQSLKGGLVWWATATNRLRALRGAVRTVLAGVGVAVAGVAVSYGRRRPPIA